MVLRKIIPFVEDNINYKKSVPVRASISSSRIYMVYKISEGSQCFTCSARYISPAAKLHQSITAFQSEGLVPEDFEYETRPTCLYEFPRRRPINEIKANCNVNCCFICYFRLLGSKITLLSPSYA